jgi:hypothetical protein
LKEIQEDLGLKQEIEGDKKPIKKILIQIEIFDRIPDKFGGITGRVRKTLLESGEEAGHIRCPKPDSPVLTDREL